MFTGIIEEVGVVRLVSPSQLVISADKVLGGTKLGDSLAVNGACLTVTGVDSHSFSVEVMPETQRRTNLGRQRPGDKVNLERPLTLSSHLGGHLIQGHIDTTGKVISMIPEGTAVLARYAAPPEVMGYLVEKGFIAVDGVSLTITEVENDSFTVSLVDYTLRNTNLGERHPGDLVNLEVDIIAKYVEKLLRQPKSAISWDFLAERGFL
jgi:riboflavin synthase